MQKKIPPWFWGAIALFWGLMSAGFVTKREEFITAGLAVFTVFAVALVIRKVRMSSIKKQELLRIWTDGTPGTAKVISISMDGSGMNHHPNIDFELMVSIEGRPAYPLQHRGWVSKLAIPRI
jgi:hypothetical protein